MGYKINPEFILLIEKLKGKHKFDDLYDTGFQELTGNTYDYISEELIGIYLKSLGYTGIISVRKMESVHVDYYWDVFIKELIKIETQIEIEISKVIFEYNGDWHFKFTEEHIAELVANSYDWYHNNYGNNVNFDMMRVVMTFILKPNEFNDGLAYSEYTANAIKNLIPKHTKLKW